MCLESRGKLLCLFSDPGQVPLRVVFPGVRHAAENVGDI